MKPGVTASWVTSQRPAPMPRNDVASLPEPNGPSGNWTSKCCFTAAANAAVCPLRAITVARAMPRRSRAMTPRPSPAGFRSAKTGR
jgi:hypothetical protein